MIPFSNTLPYELIMGDVYVDECPFCQAEHVLLPLKPNEFKLIQDGKKKLLIFPCCNNKVTVLDVDMDYLLCDQRLR